jgi:hypothetical protein
VHCGEAHVPGHRIVADVRAAPWSRDLDRQLAQRTASLLAIASSKSGRRK